MTIGNFPRTADPFSTRPMTLLQYLAQQHRFAKWQIRKLMALDTLSDEQEDELYFFDRLEEYIQEQREHHRSLKPAQPHPYPYISERGVDELFLTD